MYLFIRGATLLCCFQPSSSSPSLVICFAQQLLTLLLRTALLCRHRRSAGLGAEIKIKGLAALRLFWSLALGLDKIFSTHTIHCRGGGTSAVYSAGGTLHLHADTHPQTHGLHPTIPCGCHIKGSLLVLVSIGLPHILDFIGFF